MRRRLQSEQGVALTVAIFTLAMIALFSALIASTAGQLTTTSNESRDAKRAVAVANTGVATALDRLNRLTSPLSNLGCLTNVVVNPYVTATPVPGVTAQGGGTVSIKAGNCPPASGRAGNDGTWTYEITLLNNNQHCDDQYTTQAQVNNLLAFGVGGISVLRRCIVSTGVVNGVQRRVQQEIYSDFRLFHGLVGLDSVKARGTGADLGTSHVGTNKLVDMDPGTIFGGQVELRAGGKDDKIEATGIWGITERPEPWIADAVDVGPDDPTDSATVTCGLLCNPWEGGSAAGRRLRVTALETVTFTETANGGNYRLCELHLDGGTVVVSGTVNLWIDDDCAGNGLVLNGGGLLNTVGLAVPQNLRIYVEGNRPVNIGGGLLTQANLSLYAPESTVTIDGLIAPIVKGSITAKNIVVQKGTFVGDPLLDITAPFAQIAGKWHPGKWSECRAHPPDPNDYLSGCND